MAAPSAPLPPAIEAAHRVLADGEPMSAADLSERLRTHGFRLPIDRLAQLPDRFPDRFHMTADGHLSIGPSGNDSEEVIPPPQPNEGDWYRPATHGRVTSDRVAVLDIETTGLDPAKDFIWELALVRLDGQHLADIAVTLPEGITKPCEDDRVPVPFPMAIEALTSALTDIDLIVGHNLLAFDIPFLAKAAKRAGAEPPKLPRCADSIHLSLLIDSTIPNRSLADLLQRLEITRDATHRALSDASATAEVVRGLLAEVDMSEPSWPLAIAVLESFDDPLASLLPGLCSPPDISTWTREPDPLLEPTGAATADAWSATRDAFEFLQTERGLRNRDAQREMAHAVAEVFDHGGRLAVEAPTGTGKLTASPFSMGTTALRMAERHPDERVRRVLNEVGHLAMDIKGSARENMAMKITNDWVREHGRVLIFTQHTDTLTGLLRRMTAEGLNAKSFHGSMSPTERAKTISAFRSGEAPVMISTDAGAEGQNLQFCNCVLNFDLPWNPMRIEQRIGRVDRLTQPRDEVHIANLYARGTIDESVYRLLAEKLRMFELLFGQVTTILGELDDSKSATFETRVMEALFAEDDTRMGRLLGELGTELADAREKASTLIAADNGLSSWMTTAFEHRKGLTKSGATELTPAVTERARMRQRRVQTWVRQVLTALSAVIIHDTGEGDGAFLTVQLDEELVDELGGRTVLHLAFDRLGMEHHPDAELCAVGSPVFEELLGLLRMRGDLHATVPVIAEVEGTSPYPHSTSTTLLTRRLIPSEKWSGQATFRATVGEAETTEHIITANISDESQARLQRRPLMDGESLPAAFDVPAKVVAKFERAATVQLEKLRRDRASQIERDQANELKRVQDGYTAQIAEATNEDKTRLRRALSSEEKRLSRAPDVRSRAKLLAITLDENDWVIEETWAGPGGSERSLSYEWGQPAPEVLSDVSLQPVRVLALCSGGHFVDDAERIHCESCDLDRCTECGMDSVLADCLVCGTDCCGECRDTLGGLCRRCAAPERAPDLDKEFSIAWRLNEGVILRVGERSAELAHNDQLEMRLLVPDDDVDDPTRIKARSYALANGLPADSGVVLNDLPSRHADDDPDCMVLRSNGTVAKEFSIDTVMPSALNEAAVEHLPENPRAIAQSASEFGVGALLEKLRNEVPPPPPPTTMVTLRPTFTDLVLDVNDIVERISTVDDSGALRIDAERTVPLHWQESTVNDDTLATGELANVRVAIERRNEAALITVEFLDTSRCDRWIALPDNMSADLQLDWFDVLNGLGMPGGRIGQRLDDATEIKGPFPSPSECEIADRCIESVVQLDSNLSDVALKTVDDAVRPPARMLTARDRSQQLAGPPDGLRRALLGRMQRSFTTVARRGLAVRETWDGHGRSVHEYETFDGTAARPLLADVGAPGDDFGVCRDGHFYAAKTAARCASCETWACRACDDVTSQAAIPCRGCSAEVCRRCLSTEHSVPTPQCVLCGDSACSECGRDPLVKACNLCARNMCARCQPSTTCVACSSFMPASDDVLLSLPAELAASGARVLAASDTHATTLLIDRGGAIEHAVLKEGSVARWIAFGQVEIGPGYRLRLAASRALGTQVTPAESDTASKPSIPPTHLVIESERSYAAEWTVPQLNISGRGTTSFQNEASDLLTAILDTFAPASRLPVASAETPTEVLHAFPTAPAVETLPLEIGWRTIGRDLSVTGSGLSQRTIDGSTTTEECISWSDRVNQPWVEQHWLPIPTVRASASTGTADVVVVSMATLMTLGVRAGGQTRWYSIVPSPNAPAATALARATGLGDADEVSEFTDPARIVRSTVVNATNVSVTIEPVAEVDTRALNPGRASITAEALAAWRPDAQVRVPILNETANELRLDLVRAFDHRPEHVALRIGATVEEIAYVDSGQAWQYGVALSPGECDARRFDSKSMHRSDHGVLDREGHFVAADVRCPYCNSRMCSLCKNGLQTCDCCGVLICLTCIREPHQALWLCPACESMRPPTRSEARQHGRLIFAGGMLIGTDDNHVVVVEQSKKSWVRRVDNGEKKPLAMPSLTHFLSERLSGDSSRD